MPSALFALYTLWLLVALAAPAVAAPFEWTGAGTNAYEDGASWLNTQSSTTGTVPTAGDTATFNIADTITLASNHDLDRLDVVSGSTSLSSVDATARTLTVTQTAISSEPTIRIDGATSPDLPQLTVGDNVMLNAVSSGGAPSTLVVGEINQGNLSVSGAASVVSAQQSIIGATASAVGQVTVTGDTSRWSTSQTLTVGQSGAGTLNVTAGGDVFPSQTFVGSQAGSTGNITVDGTGSLLSTLLLDVGSQGTSTVNVLNDGFIEVNGQLQVNSQGSIVVTDGMLRVGNNANVDGGSLQIATAGTLDLGAGRTLTASDNASLTFVGYTIDNTSTIAVQSSSDLLAEELHLGSAASAGTLNIDGLGSSVNLTSTTTPSSVGRAVGEGNAVLNLSNNGELIAGVSGITINPTATVNVNSGADFETSGPLTIDGGVFNVSGKGSAIKVLNSAPFTLGGPSSATLNILDKSTVRTSSAGLSINAGGEVNVTGAGAGGDRSFLFADGDVVVDGGTLNVGAFADFFLIGGDTLTARNNAQVDFGDVQEINTGETIIVESGASLTAETFELTSTGTMTLTGGTIVADTIDNSAGGAFNFAGGQLSTDTYTGNLVNQAGTLAPGDDATAPATGTTAISGDYEQQASATLAIDLNAQHDQVTVAGTATLAGDIEVALVAGFTPQPTDTFTVVSAGTLSGQFDNAAPGQQLIESGGLATYEVSYTATEVVLSDFASIVAGDFNDDGTVDIADYTVWRDNLGAADESALNGNGTGDGVIDESDYALWQTFFGLTAPASLNASQAQVPEPSTLILIAGVCLVAAAKGRKQA